MLTERERGTKYDIPSQAVKVDERQPGQYETSDQSGKWDGTTICALSFKVGQDGEVYLRIEGQDEQGFKTGECEFDIQDEIELFDYVSQ